MAQENTKILSAPKGSSKKKHRVGRGQGSGWGCTAGIGDKGAQSRAVIAEERVLKADRCLCIEEFQKAVLIMRLLKSR